MLTINVKEHEFYDGQKEMFFYTKPVKVRMEHSLISIAKWEARWNKPYLPSFRGRGVYGVLEEQYYISCMIIGTVPEYIPSILLQNYSVEIEKYITDPQSATKIYRMGDSPPSTQTVTAELIYYWMIKFGIPFDCERWHFNRLLMLIDVCNVKESSGKDSKMSTMDSANYRHQLNKARRAGL